MQFALLLGAFALAACLLAYNHFIDDYSPHQPERECETPYDYPICLRTDDPQPQAVPPLGDQYFGIAFVAILGLVLVHSGWRASVTKQAELVTMFSSGKQPPAQQPPQQAAPAQQAVQQPQAQQQVPVQQSAQQPPQQAAPAQQPVQQPVQQQTQQTNKDAWGHNIPPAIPNNDLQPGDVEKPRQKPQQGVDIEKVNNG